MIDMDMFPDFEGQYDEDHEDHELGYRDSPHLTVSSDEKAPRRDA